MREDLLKIIHYYGINEQLKYIHSEYYELDEANQDKILSAIKSFEILGTKYKNINQLDYDLFEIKPKGVRAYFQYDENRKRIIIIGFITLKKTQKAPKRYMKQALSNIKNYKNAYEITSR